MGWVHLMKCSYFETAGATWRKLARRAASFLALIFLAACRPQPSPALQPLDLPEPSLISMMAEAPVEPSTPTPQPTDEKFAQPLTLIVPEAWETLAQRAVDFAQLSARIQMETDPATVIRVAAGEVMLVPGEAGLPIGELTMALSVPFWHPLEELTMDQAKRVWLGEDPGIAVLPWREMTPDRKALEVDGAGPGDPGYPFHQVWSLMHAPEDQEAAAVLAQALAAALAQESVIELAAVGDIMLDRALGLAIQEKGWEYPFEDVVDLLRSADLTLGNLESAIGACEKPQPKGYTFCAPLEAMISLADAGFDLLSLANNHAMDCGPDLMLQTMDRLGKHGIRSVGAGANATQANAAQVVEVSGIRLAFLAYVDVPVERRGFDTRTWIASGQSPGVAWAEPALIALDVTAAAQNADLVIVLLHSGTEFDPLPNETQRRAAHAAIDAGAALVLGHHAHVLQPLEFYQDGVIAYGLGNFAFHAAGPQESLVLHLWLDQQGVRQVGIDPVVMQPYDGRPILPSFEQAQAIRSEFYRMTRGLNAP